MRSPSARACANGFNTTTPAPSLRTKPFALSSKAKQRLSGLNIDKPLKPTNESGSMKIFTPPASACVDSPFQIL
ncbi:unannotated protein [freshwater metagenome]|uniref:Unannotated protein n=1 Tax=freshwater metagenome TaxID=449393 RepID=A0A6J6Z2F0_9ZZZZ